MDFLYSGDKILFRGARGSFTYGNMRTPYFGKAAEITPWAVVLFLVAGHAAFDTVLTGLLEYVR
jgi:hypothetical protein